MRLSIVYVMDTPSPPKPPKPPKPPPSKLTSNLCEELI